MNRIDVEMDGMVLTGSKAVVELVEDAVAKILEREGFSDGNYAQLTVLLTDDARLQRLNREFAGDDHITDVLSFSADTGDYFPETESRGVRPRPLGDIAISVPQTNRQASDKGVPFERELAMLAIHGALHLMGYDHAEPEDERVMFGKTDEALDEIFST